jgi:hypothetical protein
MQHFLRDEHNVMYIIIEKASVHDMHCEHTFKDKHN